MTSLRIRRIECAHPSAAEAFGELRTQLSAQGNVVSARSQALTEMVFGQPLSPAQVVERICADVQSHGLNAVIRYSAQFDRVTLTPETIRVSRKELVKAHAAAGSEFLETIRRIRQNILAFQLGILHNDAILHIAGSHELRLRYRPMRRVGALIPGGAAAYPSTLLMTVCPAQAAGVKELAVVMPPTKTGAYNDDQLALCHELGITEVYRIGGAQAVAALAYGVEGIPGVDMIVGPGNMYVALAKRHVFGQVGIDCIAGPSEIVIVADDSARPDFVAADLLAQAEHAPGASILVTWHASMLDAVAKALESQLTRLERGEFARESLERFGAFVLARDDSEALACVNQLAPEHLHIATREPESFADRVENAGAIFLGHHTPVALGDYAAGPSHVLPTGGTARFASGLSANDFLRRSSVLSYTAEGLANLAGDVRLLAGKEGLTGHAASVEVRLEGGRTKRTPVLAGDIRQ
jgi:histidinol dehydrogenase